MLSGSLPSFLDTWSLYMSLLGCKTLFTVIYFLGGGVSISLSYPPLSILIRVQSILQGRLPRFLCFDEIYAAVLGFKTFSCSSELVLYFWLLNGIHFSYPQIFWVMHAVSYYYWRSSIPSVVSHFFFIIISMELFSIPNPILISFIVGRVFTYGLGDPCSIPCRVIPKIQKMVLDASLLNTLYY